MVRGLSNCLYCRFFLQVLIGFALGIFSDLFRPIAAGHDRQLTGCTIHPQSEAVRGGLQRDHC